MEVKEIAGVCLPETLKFCSPTSASLNSSETLEPYTTEKLGRIPGGYKALTESFQVLTVNFNNLQVIYWNKKIIIISCYCRIEKMNFIRIIPLLHIIFQHLSKYHICVLNIY